MTLTLWGRANSANVQKAMWMLGELGIEYQHHLVGGAHGGTDTGSYRALNPNGLVPTLSDGGLVVWESHAILRYLAARYAPGTLYAEDIAVRAVADQWTDWTSTRFQRAWLGVFWLVVRTPLERHDKKAIASSLHECRECFSILDTRLRNKKYLAGSTFGYADIAAGASLYRWYTMPVDRPEHRHVEAWYGRLQQRPAFRKAIMVSYDELVGRLEF